MATTIDPLTHERKSERMVLADADRKVLARALMNPPKLAPRLVAVMKRDKTGNQHPLQK